MDRAALLAAMGAAKPKPVAVEVPAWGGTVYVKALTLAEAEDLGANRSETKRNLARGLAAVIVDEQGRRIFDPNNTSDVDLIETQSMSSLNGLLSAANGVNDLGKASTPAKS